VEKTGSHVRWRSPPCCCRSSARVSSGGTGTAPTPAAPSGDNGLFTLNSGAGGQPQAGGEVLATIELSAPSRPSYVVRATIPVPPGTFPRPDGKLPLAIRDVNGFVVPTQVEIVSRYANSADGADVVEVLGRVQRPAGVAAGHQDPLRRRRPPAPQLEAPDQEGRARPDLPPRLGAARRPADVFGNEYRFDAFDGVRDVPSHNSVKTLKQGPAAVQLRTYGTMHPSGTNLGAPTGALPHFLGVHAYTTAWALEDFLSLELRVNNGASGADKSPSVKEDDPLGDVYFQSIELWVPSGWSVVSDVSDPFVGATHPAGSWTAYELVKPNADGTLHLMPEQAMLHRRLAITRSAAVPAATAALERESLAFCVKGSSPSASRCGRGGIRRPPATSRSACRCRTSRSSASRRCRATSRPTTTRSAATSSTARSPADTRGACPTSAGRTPTA
jgi:hypothetical protein